MARLSQIDEQKLSSEQRDVYVRIKRLRGQMRGPLAVLLRNPVLAEYTLNLQDLFASRVTLERARVGNDPGVGALCLGAVCLVRSRTACAHGISPEVIEAIRERRAPNFRHEDERFVSSIGSYAMGAVILTGFDVAVPGGIKPLLYLRS